MATYTSTRHHNGVTATLTIETEALTNTDRALLREAFTIPGGTGPTLVHRSPAEEALASYDARRDAGDHRDALNGALGECAVLRGEFPGIADAAYAFAGTSPHTMRHYDAREVLAYVRAALVSYPTDPDVSHIHIDDYPSP